MNTKPQCMMGRPTSRSVFVSTKMEGPVTEGRLGLRTAAPWGLAMDGLPKGIVQELPFDAFVQESIGNQ